MSFASKLNRFMPTEVYPLVGAVLTGCGLSVYAMHHHLVYNPDIGLKTTQYSWERFPDAGKISPHLHFLEGSKANRKLDEFMNKGEFFASPMESFEKKN